MHISVKTNLIEINVDDNITLYQSYTKRSVPELDSAVKIVVDEAIKLHNEVAVSIKTNVTTNIEPRVVVKKETV